MTGVMAAYCMYRAISIFLGCSCLLYIRPFSLVLVVAVLLLLLLLLLSVLLDG
jgi:hypothetical protein